MQKAQIVFLGLGLAVLAGCSGGGSSSSGSSSTGGSSTAPAATASKITVTSAAGAPIVGTVTIKDSSVTFQTKTVTIGADGKSTIDVTGMTAPFMMIANGTVGGRSYSLYSAAALADVGGMINITPLTDLIVANVAGQIASTFFTAGNFSSLTTAELNAQETEVQARVQPILTAAGVPESIDLLRDSFAADHTGLDAALDVLRIDIVGTIATITNIISNEKTTDDISKKFDTVVPIGATGVATGIAELRAIVARFNAWSALFATSVPASNDATLLALFDTGFLFEGQNTAAFLSDLTTGTGNIGIKFTNISLIPGSMTPVSAPTTAKVSFDVILGGVTRETHEFTLNKVGSVWKMAGDQRIAQARAHPFARLQDLPTNNSIDTGLVFNIGTPTASGLASIPATVPMGAGYYAIVTGPGLPALGALYVDARSGIGSFYAASGIPSTYQGILTPKLNTYGHNQYPLTDLVIAALADNAIYTIKIYHDGATATTGATANDVLLATYTSNAGKRPYLRSELTMASFAAITALDKKALTTFSTAGGTTTVTWTLPTATVGAASHRLSHFRSGSTGFHSTNVNVLPTGTSATLTVPSLAAINIGTLVNNGFFLTISDSFGRKLNTISHGT